MCRDMKYFNEEGIVGLQDMKKKKKTYIKMVFLLLL